MSEESVKQPDSGSLPPVVSTILANPYDKVPPEKLLELLEIWKTQVEGEIAGHEKRKDDVYVVYKRQKDLYDKWLSGPLGRMKKIDKTIAGRKKVLIDVNKEINKLKESLTPTESRLIQTNKINGEIV